MNSSILPSVRPSSFYPFGNSFRESFIFSFIHSFIHSFVHPFIHSFIHSFNGCIGPEFDQLITVAPSCLARVGNGAISALHQSINQSINQSILSTSIHLSIHSFICLSVNHLIHLPIHSSIHPSIHPSINQSIKLLIFFFQPSKDFNKTILHPTKNNKVSHGINPIRSDPIRSYPVGSNQERTDELLEPFQGFEFEINKRIY